MGDFGHPFYFIFQETTQMGVNALFARSRFTIVLLFLLINLGTFALLRVALLIKQLADIDTPVYKKSQCYLINRRIDVCQLLDQQGDPEQCEST